VLTAGATLSSRAGCRWGVFEKVVPDPDRDSFIDVIVKPSAHLDRLDEVLVLPLPSRASPPSKQQDMATSETLKRRRRRRPSQQQQRPAQIMAERLPGCRSQCAAANPAAPGQTAQPGQTRPLPSQRRFPSFCPHVT